jgi:hypothetical protein
MHRRVLAATVASLALVGPGLLPGSSAASTDRAEANATPLARGLVGPLSLAVAPDGTRYFSENFAGKLRTQKPGGSVTTLFKSKGGAEVGAVSVAGGVVTFAISRGNNEKGVIKQISASGAVSTLANTGKHENKDNPDGQYRYGFRGLSSSCKQNLPDFLQPATYRGVPETHPYATTTVAGTTYVADAGANAIFAISAAGDISTVGAVPPAKVKITRKGAEANGLPKCTVGKSYLFEAVPTDVEVGPDGYLYITSLPGGPEDGSLGRQGRVLRMNPADGATTVFADGLASPTGLAVAANGDVLVGELFRGRISRIDAATGIKSTFADVKMPGDVEIAGSATYATAKVLTGLGPKGKQRGQVIQLVPSAS